MFHPVPSSNYLWRFHLTIIHSFIHSYSHSSYRYCRDNPDKERNTCEAAEENIDSGEADVGRASYDKTVKKKKEEEKRIKKAKEEADKRHSLSKMAQMQRENAKLKKKMIEMEKNTPLDEEDEGKGDEEVNDCVRE